MAYHYLLENFVSTPTSEDKSIKIFDQYGVFKYSIDANLSYFYYKSNFVFIKQEHTNDITLDFETNAIAISALEKLNSAKKIIVAQATADITYYTKTELDSGVLDGLYLSTSGVTAILVDYSTTAHTHTIENLSGVTLTSIQNGEVLTYSNGIWVNSSFTFDTSAFTSNYYTIEQLSNSATTGITISWNNIVSAHTHLWSDLTTTAHTHDERYSITSHTHDSRYFTQTVSDIRYLQSGTTNLLNYYTKTQTDTLFYNSAQTLALFTTYYTSAKTNALLELRSSTAHTHNQYSITGHSHAFSGLTNTAHTHLWSDLTTTAHTHDERYSITGHSHDFSGLTNTAHTHLWSDLTTTAHTHNEYSLTGHNHSQYATTIWVDANHYTIDQTDANFLSANTSFYTQSQSNTNFLSANTSFYTQSQVNGLLNTKSSSAHTHTFSGLTNTAHTHLWGDISNTAHTHNEIYYTESEVDTLISGFALNSDLTAHTSLTGVSNPHLTSFNNLTSTAHTHDDRYYVGGVASATPTLNPTGDASGNGILDVRYFTKIVSDARYLQSDSTGLTNYYTSAITNLILDDYYTSAQTDALFLPYYTSAQTDTLLLGKSNTGHSHDFTGLTSTAHTHLWSDLTTTAHTHDDRYYTETEIDNALLLKTNLTLFNNHTGQTNPHQLSFTGLTSTAHTHNEYSLTSHTHSGYATTVYVGANYLSISDATTYYYNSAQTNALLLSYYTSAQTDAKYSLTSHTHTLDDLSGVTITSPTQDNILVYSGGTWVNTTLADVNVDLSPYYTSAQTDAKYSLTSHTHNQYSITGHSHDFTGLTSTAHTHLWSDLTTTAHTHDDIYSLTSHTHSGYATTIWVDANYLTSTALTYYYNSAQTIALFLPYYTSAQTNALLELRSVTGHSHYVTGLTDVVVSALTYGQVLIYSAGTWINSAITSDLTNYYTQSEIDGIITGLTFATGATILDELGDVTITSITTGDALVYDGVGWVNSAITADLSPYYTSAQTNVNFISANTSLFSSSGHSHYLSGLTDIVSGWTATDGQFLQFSSSLSGWTPVTSVSLLGDFVDITGDTMTGPLSFSFMTGTTNRVLSINSGGTIIEGDEILPLYFTDPTIIEYITYGDTSGSTVLWSGRTFVYTGLTSASTMYEGQKYIDNNYFYEYFDGTLYRDYFIDDFTSSNYYTKTELSPTGLTAGVLDYRYLGVNTLTAFTLRSLYDVYDFDLGSLNNNLFLKYNTDSGWTTYYMDLTGLTYRPEVVLTGVTVIGVSGLSGGGTLNNNLQIYHLTASTRTSVQSTTSPTPTSLIQSINWDAYGHVNSYVTADYSGYWIQNIDDANDIQLTSRQVDDYLAWTGTKWANYGLTMSRVSGLTTEFTNYVKKTGASSQTIAGDLTFSDDLVIQGNLRVNGTQTIIYTTDLAIKDKLIALNSGETSPSVNEQSGLMIDRGDKPNYYIVFDEGSSVETSGGTVKIGIASDLKQVLTIDDLGSLIITGVSAAGNSFDIQVNSGGSFAANSSFTYDFDKIALTIGSRSGATGMYSIVIGKYNTSSGYYSSASGRYSIASGSNSNSNGFHNTASGNYSTASGAYSTASGVYSSARGNQTTASGNYSTTNGYQTTASGYYSTASGTYSIASGEFSMASGAYSTASGQFSNASGRYTDASGTSSISSGFAESSNYKIIASGITSFNHSYRTNTTPNVSGATGNYSAILGGVDQSAIGEGSIVLGGKGNIASGKYSTAFGYLTTASGLYSISSGNHSTSSGNYSTSSGYYSTASGYHSTASGFYTIASGQYSIASGIYTTASGSYSNASGYHSTASGQYSIASGYYTLSNGTSSIASGHAVSQTYKIIASGITSFNHSHRNNTTPNVSGATGNYSAILGGQDQSATGTHSIVLGGSDNIASGDYSTAQGRLTISSGDYSHTEGYYTIASGDFSHSEGNQTIASANYSHSEGLFTIASGVSSHAGGYGTTGYEIIASGIASFNHSYRDTTTPNVSGATGDYSAILGGINHTSTGVGSVILGGSGNTVTHDRSVILGGYNLISDATDTVYGINANFTTYYGDGSNLIGIETTQPFYTLTAESTTNWNLSSSTNAELTLYSATTLEIAGVTDGMYGTIKIIQGTSGNTLTFGTGTHKTANGGGGAIILSTALGSIDILSFVYDGTNYLWNAGYNFT